MTQQEKGPDFDLALLYLPHEYSSRCRNQAGIPPYPGGLSLPKGNGMGSSSASRGQLVPASHGHRHDQYGLYARAIPRPQEDRSGDSLRHRGQLRSDDRAGRSSRNCRRQFCGGWALRMASNGSIWKHWALPNLSGETSVFTILFPNPSPLLFH